MELNKIFTHNRYKIDFDKKEVKCLKCGHRVKLRDFAYSLLIFDNDKGEQE